MDKTRLPHQPVRNDSPSHPHFSFFLRFQFRRLRRCILPNKIRRRVAPAKFPRKCFKSKSLYLLQLLLTLFKLVARLELQVEVPFPCGCNRSIKAAGWLGQGTLQAAFKRPIPILVHEIKYYRFLKVLLYSQNSSTRPAEVYIADQFLSSSCWLCVSRLEIPALR